MRDIRIVFMGTPDFAVTILQHLIENKYNVVGVITLRCFSEVIHCIINRDENNICAKKPIL